MFRSIKNINVDGFDVRLVVSANNNDASYSGEVYPFLDHFHSVDFSAYLEVDFSAYLESDREVKDARKVEYEISTGGNTFSGISATQYAKAVQVAVNLANKYAEKISAMNSSSAVRIIREQMNLGNYGALAELLSLCANIKEKENNRSKLTKLDAICALPSFLELVNRKDSLKNDELSLFFDTIANLYGQKTIRFNDVSLEVSRRERVLTFLLKQVEIIKK